MAVRAMGAGNVVIIAQRETGADYRTGGQIKDDAGLAMRFPRINRLRWDKPPGEADRLERLETMIERIEQGQAS